MAKSKAKKLREKLVREGKMNPECKRSPFVFSDMRTRMTKTKKDHLYQFKYKNHQTCDGNDGSFYFTVRDISFSNLCCFTYNRWASSIDTVEKVILVSGTA
jgi:hypothetical protein